MNDQGMLALVLTRYGGADATEMRTVARPGSNRVVC
jgi:hypothetical protein